MLEMLLSAKEASRAWTHANKLLEKQITQTKVEEKGSTSSTPRSSQTPRTPHSPHTPPPSPKGSDIILSTFEGVNNLNIVAYKENKETIVFAYDLKQQLGEAGAQGAVYKAQRLYHDPHKNQNLANVLVLKHSAKIETQEDFENEKEILNVLGRLSGFASVASESQCLQFLFSQFCDGENLLDMLYDKVAPNEHEKKYYSFSYVKKILSTTDKLKLTKIILDAVFSLHSAHSVFHRDLKSANIIISKDLSCAQLVDFGTSCKAIQSDKTFKGSMGYQAIEMTLPIDAKEPALSRPFYSLQTEYFSLAIVLLEVLSSFNYQSFIRQQLAQSNVHETFVITLEHILFAFKDVLSTPDKKEDTEEDKLLWSIIQMCKANISPNPNLRLSYTQFNQKYQNFCDRLSSLVTTLRTQSTKNPQKDDLVQELKRKLDGLSLEEEKVKSPRIITTTEEKERKSSIESKSTSDKFLSPETGRTRSASMNASMNASIPTGESKRPEVPLHRTKRQYPLPILNFAITPHGDSPKSSPHSDSSSPWGSSTSSSYSGRSLIDSSTDHALPSPKITISPRKQSSQKHDDVLLTSSGEQAVEESPVEYVAKSGSLKKK